MFEFTEPTLSHESSTCRRVYRYDSGIRWAQGEKPGLPAVGRPTSVGLMDYRKIITIDPDKRGGKPCIRGMRITVYDVLDYLAGGMSTAEILADFPDLTAEDIQACLAFAADRERRLLTIPAA